MQRRGARWVTGMTVCCLLGGTLAACGEEESSYRDAKIVDALKLEQTNDGYTVDGDPFCIVSDRFFNDSGEVEAAKGSQEAELVIASREGNVAVEGVPPFAPDCKEQAKKRLNKLDEPAKD